VVFDRVAEAVKDALVDWDWSPPDEAEETGAPPLPALSAEEFIVALRPQVEDALRRVAACLNEGSDANLSPAAEQRVLDLFGRLCSDAWEVGLALRTAAADARPAPVPAPRGEWARRYRRMMFLEGRWPYQAEDSGTRVPNLDPR
jgi:hypothetical protein